MQSSRDRSGKDENEPSKTTPTATSHNASNADSPSHSPTDSSCKAGNVSAPDGPPSPPSPFRYRLRLRRRKGRIQRRRSRRDRRGRGGREWGGVGSLRLDGGGTWLLALRRKKNKELKSQRASTQADLLPSTSKQAQAQPLTSNPLSNLLENACRIKLI